MYNGMGSWELVLLKKMTKVTTSVLVAQFSITLVKPFNMKCVETLGVFRPKMINFLLVFYSSTH